MEKDSKKSQPGQEMYRFGSIAVSRRYVTLAQVQQALAIQIEDNVNGRKHRILGDILLEKQWISDEQVASILSEIGVGKE
jgi:hypothetical protein